MCISISILFLQVKVLYVRNLKADITEEQLKEHFESYGKIERVKKIKDYGFVHFEDRDHALKAMEELNGSVSWLQKYFSCCALSQSHWESRNMLYCTLSSSCFRTLVIQ